MPSKRKTIDDYIQNNSLKSLVIVVVFVGGLLFLGIVLFKQFAGGQRISEVAVVEFADGQNKVVVERNGIVTINTPYGTFTQKWDASKVADFFSRIDNMNFDAISEFLGGDLAITLTMGDGDKIQVMIEELPDVVADDLQIVLEDTYDENELLLPSHDIYLGQITKTNNDASESGTPANGNNSGNDVVNGVTNDEVIDDPWKGNDNVEEEFECEYVIDGSGKRVVINNTLCEQ